MIDPLYGGHAAHAIVQSMLDDPDVSAYEAVRANWADKTAGKGADADFGWRKALHDGLIADTAFTPKTGGGKAAHPAMPAQTTADSIEIIFRPDYHVYDGRYANVGMAAGDSPAGHESLLGQRGADELRDAGEAERLEEHDVLEITLNGKKVLAPALAVPGHPDDAITLHLGQGRKVGRVAGGVGFNAYQIRPSDASLFASGATIKKTGDVWGFAVTKSHYIDQRSVAVGGDGSGTHSLEGNEAIDRGIIRYATLEEFKQPSRIRARG